MEDDKPFVCTAPGCGMRFANSDHSNVHKQKHQLMISIGSISGENLVDQTPTPTRFVKDVDADLFEGELSGTNPFDQGFREAAAKNVQSMKPPAVTSIGSLSTSTVSTTSTLTLAAKKLGRPRVKFTNSLLQNALATATPTPTTVVKTDPQPSEQPKPTEVVKKIQPKETQPSESKGIPVKTTVIRLKANTNIAAIIADPLSHIPEATMPVPGQKGANISSATMLSVPTPAIVASTRPIQNGGSPSSAKQKLKQALEQNSRLSVTSPSQVTVTSHSSTYGTPDINGGDSNGLNDVDFFYADSGSGSPGSAAPSPEGQDVSRRGPMKRNRRNQEDLDPDERRKKFLERNRAAASRCRQKRKIWVQQLEKKADELSMQNGQLQNEITVLRTEVAQLKALLLTHKDCPVTMQQKAMMDQVNPVTFIASNDSQVVKASNLSAGTQLKVTTTAEEVATSALTDMANRATMELEGRVTTPTISLSDNVINTNGNVLL